jgi:uncharacterized protein YxjI
MGLFGNDDDAPRRCFMMREKLIGLGNDYWIEDDAGENVYKVDGKTARLRDTWKLEDADGKEVAVIREKMLAVRDAIKIEVGDQEAVVRKQLIGIGEKYNVDIEDGKDLKVKGDIIGHEYTIERDGDTIAEISQKHFRMRDTYGIEVLGDVDPALVISVAVAVESMND